MAQITIRPGDGSPPYPTSDPQAVVTAIQAGSDIVAADGHTFGIMQVPNISGGWLLDGCPISAVLGVPISTADAAILQSYAAVLKQHGWTACLGIPGSVGPGTTATSGSTAGTPGGAVTTGPGNTVGMTPFGQGAPGTKLSIWAYLRSHWTVTALIVLVLLLIVTHKGFLKGGT